MKFTIGVSALAATAIAHVCDQQCGSYCEDEGGASLTNWDNAGFEDSAECQTHPCSATWNGVDDDKWRECEEGARELEERKYNHIVKMAKSQMTTRHSLRTVFRMLQNYGCHCFPGQTRAAGGHGPAVDAQDSLCKDLSRCHRCVEMDHGKDQINVDHDKYRFNVVNGAISCERNTEKGWHQSKRDLCECDARFANEIGKIWNDDTFNDFYWLHPKQMKLINKGKLDPEPSKFEIESTCAAPHGGQADSCCGGYPNRYPFDSAEKTCCENTVSYNSITQACCEDGSIGSIGDC